MPGLTLGETPFLTITGLSTGNEQGLLGLAFHPDYSTNGFLYVDYTDGSGDTNLVRYHVSGNPNAADAASASPVLRIRQPQTNHNGGWLGFGPDGYLYIASGDGGASYDSGSGHNEPGGNAQDLTSLLGKLLRVDVNGDAFPGDANRNYAIPPTNPFVSTTGNDEIWAYGLRNPWRCSFDRATGDLYIGDVGQDTREEIDVQSAGSGGGLNYGWRLREGTIATPSVGIGGPPPGGAIDPIYDYDHGHGTTRGLISACASRCGASGVCVSRTICNPGCRSTLIDSSAAASALRNVSMLESLLASSLRRRRSSARSLSIKACMVVARPL